MEFVLTLSVVLLAAVGLTARAILAYRRTLRGGQGCSTGCRCHRPLEAKPLVPVSALLRPRRPP